ncbi:uncharacterized protein LOC127554692 [Antechinus flavipes]|uniref:uncharacterized protein LOC127554692 n=1 Tax=Antechinus flavipes TaxID=38775 RepID=UPI002236BA6C|nr:uncharacterized protein LOC127554692 [Antechinus flavipes]XP_051842463.1 uncharacterized protein LOC127554692 [Antechinus flavipes]XP_051842464.1 uncharacterized protein LOC127554692 [Antechinus flavipes]XP_051842465.1 uncharacterized protein LOC127554692 [Antechinus flavipes]
MDKRKITSDGNTANTKKKRLVITLEQKFDVIERHERGHSNSKIGRDIGMPESTVRNIIKHAGEIKKKGKVASTFCGLQTTTRNRSITMIEMERLLAVWIEDCNKKCIPLTRAAIQTKASSLFKAVKENGNEMESEETFAASVGWFNRFKNRLQLHNAKITREAASADKDTTVWKHILPHSANSNFENFPPQNQTVIEEITNIGRKLGFDELENGDAQELLISHSEELTDNDLHLEQQVFEEASNDLKESDNMQMKEFTLKEFEDLFRAVEVMKQKIMNADPNVSRSIQIRQNVDRALCIYQHMYEDLKKKTVQPTLLKYVKQE